MLEGRTGLDGKGRGGAGCGEPCRCVVLVREPPLMFYLVIRTVKWKVWW